MGFGGKHLGRRTDREMPAGKAGFREFGTAGVFSQRPIALTIDQRSRRPASANCRTGSADPAIKPPVPTGGRHKARPTKFFTSKSRNQKSKGRSRRPSERTEKAGPFGRQPAARKWRSAAQDSRSGWAAFFNPKPKPKTQNPAPAQGSARA
jgi:hypothetical protein